MAAPGTTLGEQKRVPKGTVLVWLSCQCPHSAYDSMASMKMPCSPSILGHQTQPCPHSPGPSAVLPTCH